MSHTCIFEATEHKIPSEISNISDGIMEELQKDFLKNAQPKNEQKFKYLAINKYEKYNKKTEELLIGLQAHYYIGYRWFEIGKTYLHVLPKLDDNSQQADFMQMFLTCLKDPVVSKTITEKPDKLYKIFFDEPLIEIPDKEDKITPFLILHFLQIVKNITRKGLKKGYIKVTENLTSKIKGKILINQTIKQNHLKNRLDKTVCNHQIFTINCIENQIIKTALMQCSRHLQNINDKSIIKTLRQNINAFELVDTKEVFDSDFSKIKYSPFYKDYKEALNLAKMIFKKFGFSLDSSNTNSSTNKIHPYYINMAELFERYVESKLRESGYDILDGNNNGNIAHWKMKPDFLLKSEKMIIDAKYKYWYKNGKEKKDENKTLTGEYSGENGYFKDDYMQLSLYGRDKIIRKKIGLEYSSEEAKLLFIYPILGKKVEAVDEDILDIVWNNNFFNEQKQEKYKFNNIKKLSINLPVTNNSKE